MELWYKVYPYVDTTHNKNPDFPPDNRYCIVSTETGEVLDDAQGYGYRSVENAIRGFKYKQSEAYARMQREKSILRWLKEQPDFISELRNTAMALAFRDPEKILTPVIVEEIMSNKLGLTPGFSGEEILQILHHNDLR